MSEDSGDTEFSDELRVKMLMASAKYYLSRGGFLPSLERTIKDIIEKAEKEGKPWAFYLKSHGLKKGFLGYTQDLEEAYQYILKHNIPY